MKHIEKHVPMKEKLAWGLGGFSNQIAVNGLNTLFMPIFNMGFGVDSRLLGWAITIPRFFDMISDPVVGNMSDNSRSRYGRRRPFILIGGILMAIIFGLTYMASPHWGQWTLFAYATVSCILFYLAYTAYSVPYTALGLELTDDYDERAHIQKYRCIFNSCAGFCLPWVYKYCLKVGERARGLLEQDHVAWKPETREVFAIECKDLRLARTHNEMAEQLNRFSGQTLENGKKDELLKHLDRCKLLREKYLQLAKTLGLSEEELTVHEVVCFSKPVPMKHVSERFPQALFVTADELQTHVDGLS